MAFLTKVLVASAGLLPAVHAASSTSSAANAQYTLPFDSMEGVTMIPNVEDPNAVDAQAVCPGYKASNVKRSSRGLTATLSLAGEPCNVYGTDIETLSLTVDYQAKDRLNIQIIPAHLDASNASWYLIDEDVVPRSQASDGSVSASDLTFSWTNDPSFNFEVTRNATGDVLFSTKNTVLVYENQFIEFETSLPEDYNLYGLGDRVQQFRIKENHTLTTWAADAGNVIDENLYGTHPFYLDTRYFTVDKKGGAHRMVKPGESDPTQDYTAYSHGVFLRNAHGQEVITKPDSLVWRTLGGSVDLTIYSGPSQEEVTKNYQISTIGLPAMQQYSALGYHQARWGYANWSVMADVVATFEKFEIPLEYLWADIDYMNQYRDFENDLNTFPYEEGQEFLEKLHQSGRRFVPIIDSALYIPNPHNASDSYPTFDRGVAADAFIKNPDGSLYIGAVWPGFTVFPDWNSPNAAEYWTNELVLWRQKVPYDGIWIDMSEVASFCVGSCGTDKLHLNPVHPPFLLPGDPGNVDYGYPEGFAVTNTTEARAIDAAERRQAAAAKEESDGTAQPSSVSILRPTVTPGVRDVNYPPYVISNVHTGHDLAAKAVSPNATHSDGVLEYDVHNLWGHQILKATYDGMLKMWPGKRPFLLGRSTFSGSGKWAAHWGGDNESRFASMYFSIPQALSFSLFGMPMFGPDTCGFAGNADLELCSRWMQLSAFFPFYRNHNVLASIPQEPYNWAAVIEASKKAMGIRYAILPYFYTLFHLAHTTGSTVMRALAWEFPDPALASVDTQFLLGPSLMVVPVLEPLVDTVKGVFPGVGQGEIWYDWYTQTAVDAQPGVNTTIAAPLGHIPVFMRGGSILPMQEPALTTQAARNTPWALLAALNKNGTACGQLYLDDGETLEPTDTLDVKFKAGKTHLTAAGTGTWVESNPLANVTVMGVSNAPSNVTFNNRPVPSSSVQYDATAQVLFVGGLQNMTAHGAWEKLWTLRW